MLVPSAMRAGDASTRATAAPPPSRSRQHGQVLGALGEGHGAQRAAQACRCRQRQLRRHRASGAHVMAPRGEEMPAWPAASRRAASRPPARRREAARLAQHGEAVGQLRAGAAQLLRHPGERQPRFLQRGPRRRLPRLVLGPVDGLRIAEVGEDSRRRVDDEIVTAHDARPSLRRIRSETTASRAAYLSTAGANCAIPATIDAFQPCRCGRMRVQFTMQTIYNEL